MTHYYASRDKVVEGIVRGAEIAIHQVTGRYVELTVIKRKVDPQHKAKQLMEAVATGLGLTMGNYDGHANRENTDLRCIATVIIIEAYPQLSLHQVAELIGVKNHCTAFHYRKRCKDYLDAHDPVFCKKYYQAKKAAEQWQKG